MSKKLALAEKLERAHKHFKENPQEAPKCFIGFDGFTDEIISAVETRQDETHFKPITQMEELGKKISAAAGKSCNVELVVKKKKIGGNAPIMANALLEGGHRITFTGAIGGASSIEPLFQEMASRCEEAFPLCPSGHTDALEFHDGKVILGKHESLTKVNYENLLKHVDKQKLISLLDHADLFATTNWTMLLRMTNLWQKIVEDILPHLALRQQKKKRWLFIDLADPAKRTDQDIHQAIDILKRFRNTHEIILGLNYAEARRIAKVLKIPSPSAESDEETKEMAKNIQKTTAFTHIVIHTTASAITATATNIFHVEGPYCAKPRLTTGAGDNFNAGYCNALLYQLSEEDALLSGVATSGYYVRKEKSPTIPELVQFLHDWEDQKV